MSQNVSQIERGWMQDFEDNKDAIEAQFFLECLFGRYFKRDNSKGLIELRTIEKINGESETTSHFLALNCVRDFLFDNFHKLQKQAGRGCCISIGVNPRPPDKRKTQSDIKDITALWLDIDAKNFQDGQVEIMQNIKDFSLPPNIIVDSGHGYHLYWILEEPIINRTDEQTNELKQILSSLAGVLRSDSQSNNFDRVLRLPGTINAKDPANPKRCSIVQINQDHYYSLEDFDQYKNYQYFDSVEADQVSLDYEGEETFVDQGNPLQAQKNIENLKKISPKIKQMIITGNCPRDKNKDCTKSGRDMTVITALVAANYNYSTIKSIFLNQYLGVSNRMRDQGRGEKQLEFEVKKAIDHLSKKDEFISPAVQVIEDIKATDLNPEQKIKRISKYIIRDLFSTRAGQGYQNRTEQRYFYFDKNQKLLMNVENNNFHYFLKRRYELLEKDFNEIFISIKAHICEKGKEIEAHNSYYFDRAKYILYISNHDNQIFRLNGNRIDLVDNGCDGIFFEFRPSYTPFQMDVNNLQGFNYFEGGFDWEKFISGQSLLYESVVSHHKLNKSSCLQESSEGFGSPKQVSS